jgi:hypothetical protein
MKLLVQHLLLLICFSVAAPARSQDIATDSKGKGVFTYLSNKKVRLDFSSKDFSLTFSTPPKGVRYVKKEDDTTIINVRKVGSFYFQPALLNASDLVTLSELQKFRPGGKLKIGYQRIVDSINRNFSGCTYAIGANIFAAIDNLKLYNTEINTIEKKYPLSFGIEFNYILFQPAGLSWMLVAANASLSRGWNDEDLLNFKESKDAIITPAVVAFEKFDGKYGTVSNEINRFRISVSVPLKLGYYNPIPYVVLSARSEKEPGYFIGFYNNVLSKKINFKQFTLPTSFGLGVDWSKISGNWSSVNVFVRGNIQFGDYK